MSKNPSCIRAIPYESKDSQSLTMCLYTDTDDKKISNKIEITAKKMFKNYNIEFHDLLRRPSSKIATRLPSSEKQKKKELADLTRTIERNLRLFENRMNVTAVQASYKVTHSIEQDIPCVRVYVVGKGKIPAGETDIDDIKKKIEEGHPLKKTIFDVVEGYHKLTTGSSLEGYALPLEGGVGIGVEGVHDAGTLGGFLEDEARKVYILSNEHVLHPPNAGNVIVQPSLYDYEKMRNEARNNINKWTNKLRNIPQEMEVNADTPSRLVRRMQQKIQNTGNVLSEIEQNPPRPIGTYVCGLKDNVDVNKRKIYVDAAIATLDERELRIMSCYKTHMENPADRCPLYGFETDQYWRMNDDYTQPNGEIIDFISFQDGLRNECSELRFMKIGRTTGFTDEGFIDLPNEELFLYCHHSEDTPSLIHAGFQEWFWALNCFSLRRRRGSFSTFGDSGSLVFDKNGRAWGLVFGKLGDFSLISPLCVIVDALKRKAGLEELKLW